MNRHDRRKQAKLQRRVLSGEGEDAVMEEVQGQSVEAKHTGLKPVGVRVFEGTFRRPNIMACMPSANGLIPIEVHLSLLQLASPLNGTVDFYCLKRCEVGVARNMFVEKARSVKMTPDYILFIGDDMMPKWDAMIRLWEEAERGNWDVLGGLYHWKSDPPVPLCWRGDTVGYPEEGVTWQKGDVVECDVCGMDFTLVRMSIIDKLGDPPWFKTAIGPNEETGAILKLTEDSYFCKRVRALGGRVGVHTGVEVGHLDVTTGRIY